MSKSNSETITNIELDKLAPFKSHHYWGNLARFIWCFSSDLFGKFRVNRWAFFERYISSYASLFSENLFEIDNTSSSLAK